MAGLMSGGAPEGWLPDPQFPNHERYWDGSGWTDRTRSTESPAVELAERRRSSGGGRRFDLVTVLGILCVLVVVFIAYAGYRTFGGSTSPHRFEQQTADGSDYSIHMTKCEVVPDGAGVGVQGVILNTTGDRQTFTVAIPIRVGDQTVTAYPRASYVDDGELRKFGTYVELETSSTEPATCQEPIVQRRRE